MQFAMSGPLGMADSQSIRRENPDLNQTQKKYRVKIAKGRDMRELVLPGERIALASGLL